MNYQQQQAQQYGARPPAPQSSSMLPPRPPLAGQSTTQQPINVTPAAASVPYYQQQQVGQPPVAANVYGQQSNPNSFYQQQQPQYSSPPQQAQSAAYGQTYASQPQQVYNQVTDYGAPQQQEYLQQPAYATSTTLTHPSYQQQPAYAQSYGQMPYQGTTTPGISITTFPLSPGTTDPNAIHDHVESEVQPNVHPAFFRCTLNKVPRTPALLNKVKIPLGLTVCPYPSEEDLPQVPLINNTIVRCRRCRTYLNPFVEQRDQGSRWICNLCYVLNECTP